MSKHQVRSKCVHNPSHSETFAVAGMLQQKEADESDSSNQNYLGTPKLTDSL